MVRWAAYSKSTSNRANHNLIDRTGEFVVNLPWPEMEPVSDFVGSMTAAEIKKWHETGLTPYLSVIFGYPASISAEAGGA